MLKGCSTYLHKQHKQSPRDPPTDISTRPKTSWGHDTSEVMDGDIGWV